jgi:hypothetical protein
MALKPAQLHIYPEFTVLIPMNIPGVPRSVALRGETFHHKMEFHITAFATRHVVPAIAGDQDEAEVRTKVERILERLTATTEIGQIRLTEELRTVERDEQRTIITMCEVDGLDAFYKTVNTELGTEIPYPPTHTTLFTIPDGAPGIGLADQKQLDERSTLIDQGELPDLRTILGAANQK